MLVKFYFHCLETTVLANNLDMFILLMSLLIGFGDAVVTGGAPVVLARATHFVHAES